MKNIFENTYFGKLYKTRDGKKVLFLYYDYETKPHSYNCWVKDVGHINYNIIGKPYDYPNDSCTKLDIISEWQEEINEMELDKLAIEERNKYKEQLPFYYEFPHSEKDLNIRCMGYIDGFKDCYRKAKQE